MQLLNLNKDIRLLMLKELDIDRERDSIYYSKRLSITKDTYIKKLENALRNTDIQHFAESLLGCFHTHEQRRNRTGDGFNTVKIPYNNNVMLAEGEFNRYYIRALCLFSIQNNITLSIYRAKQVSNPRMGSEILIGKTVDPSTLLDDLRKNIGVDTALGVPAGPNSGLSVKLL